jgi:hypothetical protein
MQRLICNKKIHKLKLKIYKRTEMKIIFQSKIYNHRKIMMNAKK